MWSSDDTGGIPLSRPQALGNQLYQSAEQFAARQKQIENGIKNGESAVGSFRGDFARRAFRQTSIVVDPPDGRMPAYTPEAEKRRASRDQGTFGNGPFESVEDFTLYDRCITRGIVGSVLRVVYGNGNRIVQAPGMVAISYEMIHDTRVFYTDGRPHVSPSIRQYLGDARARWVGDELLVETTNLTDKTSIGLNGNGLRHSDRMKITERFKRVANDVLQYQITVEDPATYVKPFTVSLPSRRSTAARSFPTARGNYAVRQSLGAERAEDGAGRRSRQGHHARAAGAGRSRRRRTADRRRRPRRRGRRGARRAVGGPGLRATARAFADKDSPSSTVTSAER